MSKSRYRLAYFVSHPIQYQAPLLKNLSAHPKINLTVFFLGGSSASNRHDPGFSQYVEWDTPLTEGYQHVFLDSIENQEHYSLLNPKVNSKSIKKALSSQNWDAIWVHGYNNLAFLHVIFYSIRNGIPLLFRGESNLTSTSQGLLKDLFIRYLVKKSHALLWVSSDNKDYYRHYGAKDEQLFFSPYAVNNAFFQSFRDKEKTSTDKCVILFASKFIPRKQAPLLVKAFAALEQASQQAAELWVVGSGKEKALIESLITKHDLSNRVKLLGFKNQTELPSYYNRCNVFVLASTNEPFGLVINEAMNFSKAIITSDEVGAARDLVKHGQNGWVVQAGNKEALSTALSEAINDSAQLYRMGQNSLGIINRWSYKEDIEGIVGALEAIR